MCSNLKCSKSFRTGVPRTRNQGLVQGREKPRSETWRVDFRSFAIVWSWTWLLKNPKILNFGKNLKPNFSVSKTNPKNNILIFFTKFSKISKSNSKFLIWIFTWKMKNFEKKNLFFIKISVKFWLHAFHPKKFSIHESKVMKHFLFLKHSRACDIELPDFESEFYGGRNQWLIPISLCLYFPTSKMKLEMSSPKMQFITIGRLQ